LVIIYLSRIFCVNWHFIILLECERCIEGLICVHTHSFATVLLLDMCIHLHSVCHFYPLSIFSFPCITGFLLCICIFIYKYI
jgi:hypothetical protein